MDRLDKIIAGQTGLSRKDVHKAVAAGRICVDGKIASKADIKIDPQNCTITLDGAEISYKKYRYFLLNKPAGVVTESANKQRATVMDIFRNEPRWENLFPVGRLDKDTTGLLLITDDGDYAHRVISPKSRVEKRYVVWVDAPVPESACHRFSEGIVLADGTVCLPAEINISSKEPCCAEIVVYEGKYHQIKRMLGVLDLGVERLHRASVATLSLPDNLAAGEYVELTAEQAYSVFTNVENE